MKRTVKKFIIVLLTGLFLLGIGQAVWAEKWEPYQFKGNEYFEFKILLEEDEETKESIYILDIKESSEKSASGEEVYEVSYTTKGTLTKDELGPETAFGLMGSYGISLNMLVINGRRKDEFLWSRYNKGNRKRKDCGKRRICLPALSG